MCAGGAPVGADPICSASPVAPYRRRRRRHRQPPHTQARAPSLLLLPSGVWSCRTRCVTCACARRRRAYPLTTPMGRSLMALREMPASWHVSTTAVTSL
jgi:hypothetical protein